MAMPMETPSRIWRRIQEVEGRDMPSLPSLPDFDVSLGESSTSSQSEQEQILTEEENNNLSFGSEPMHSTPITAFSSASTVRPQGANTNSATRFAQSIASRSSKSSHSTATKSSFSTMSSHLSRQSNPNRGQSTIQDSFDVSPIPSLPMIHNGEDDDDDDDGYEEGNERSVPGMYIPPDVDADEDLEMTEEALESLSRASSPDPRFSQSNQKTPRKGSFYYEYEVSLKSEPKPSPYDKFRNVALRKPIRTRTPSLSRTTPSPMSSPTNSTPRSVRSVNTSRFDMQSPSAIPLPRSRTASPAIGRRPETREEEEEEGPSDVNHSNSRSASEPTFSSEGSGGTTPYAPLRHDFSSPAGSMSMTTPTQRRYGGSPSVFRDRDPALATPLPRDITEEDEDEDEEGYEPPTAPLPRTTTPADSPPYAIGQHNNEDDETAKDVDVEGNSHQETEPEQDQPLEEPITPHTRRRSFLLSVINSTARPRIRKLTTPHPRFGVDATPHARFADADSTIGTAAAATPDGKQIDSAPLRTAFAGVTPRPRVNFGGSLAKVNGTPHPLTQTHSAFLSPHETAISEESETDSTSPISGPHFATPMNHPPRSHSLSPYPAAAPGAENQSYVSTASSHDLTTHHPANASFDPLMMAAAGTGAVGRFNKGKLNSYLYGLNRRLEEENRTLMERVRALEEHSSQSDAGISPEKEKEQGGESEDGTARSRRVSFAPGRRVSMAGTLGVVEEGWMEEKLELETQIEELRTQVQTCTQEKQDTENALEEERQSRTRDKERWREKMGELEQGVEQIVGDLESKLRDAERRVADREQTIHEEKERAAKTEKLLEGKNELGGELRQTNERLSQALGDLAGSHTQIQRLEDELNRADRRVDELEGDLKEKKELVKTLQAEKEALSGEVDQATATIQSLRECEKDLQEDRQYIAELEEDAANAIERIRGLEEAITVSQDNMEEMAKAEAEAQETIERLQIDLERTNDLAAQMEEALEAAEKQGHSDEEEIVDLRGKVSSLEREIQRLNERSLSIHQSQHITPIGPTDDDIEALEDELDAANKEIGRLSALLNQSPARKAMEKAKDAKIEMLEKEKEELLDRVRNLRMSTTPSKVINTPGISPIHRQVLAMSIRAPKTPGGPLRDLSWLNTTMDPTVSPLVMEIGRLQSELDRANDSIDDKLDKLEEAGLGVVGLTKKLDDARAKIASLEDELSRLSRRENRRIHRLQRVRCQKCNVKVELGTIVKDIDESTVNFGNDDSLPTEPPTPPTRTSEALKANLRNVNSQLSSLKKQWEEEKRKLLGEKAALQDATNRLTAETRNAKEEARKYAENERLHGKAKAGIQSELDIAKATIAELEAGLKAERSQLRALTSEQERIRRERESITAQLKRTETDMDDVRASLQKAKQDNIALEKELRSNSNAEQKARLLELKVAGNMEAIEQLRQERSLLATDHKALQHRFAEVSERANKIRDEQAASQTSHDNRRHQLDLYLVEIDDLRRALSEQAEEFHRTEQEKDRILVEKKDFMETVTSLQADLRRVRKEAEEFGDDLKILRQEKEDLEAKRQEEKAKAERARKQSQTQIRLLNEHLDSQKERVAKIEADMKSHVCSATEGQLSSLKIQHKKECKGLATQIYYLKAKFTRECSLRCDLIYQKQYLLVLLARFERSEQTICAAIASIGFPVPSPPQPPKKRRSIRAIAFCVIFMQRARRAGEKWREQRAAREAISKALQDVRQRRTISS